jgi:hypothetical protein
MAPGRALSSGRLHRHQPGAASLREKLIKLGAKVVSHGRYVTFQMAEVAVPRQMFQEILMLIARLRAPPALARRGFGVERTDRDGSGAPF